MHPRLKTCCLLGLILALGAPWANAQDAAKEEPAAAETEHPREPLPSESPRFAEMLPDNRTAAPDVYLLPDNDGNLRKILGFSYDDFLNAWQSQRGASALAAPRFVIDGWNVAGAVEGTHAQIRVELEITPRKPGWVDVPIQLPEFIIQQVQFVGKRNGECVVYDGDRHGYVVWLSGEAGQKRQVVIEGLIRLVQNADREGVELHLPRATTSEFSLVVPDGAEAIETTAALAREIVAAESGPVEVKLLGQANPMQLSWTPTKEAAGGQSVLVEVEGQTTVRVDRRRITYEANLQINSFGKPLEQFQLRLPPGARLASSRLNSDYRIVDLPGSTGTDDRRMVEIRSAAPRTEPWSVQISAERPLKSFSGAAECEIGGFEVVDAFPQSGTIALEVDDSLQAYFDIHGDLDQISVPASAASSEGSAILGRFRYSRFPWQLVVNTSQRQRRVTVKPQHAITFNSESAFLDVQYDYELTGAKVFSLRIDLQGWRLTDSPVDAGGVIDADRLVETREGQLVIPLLDPTVQRVQVNLRLRRPSQLGETSFHLPEPLGAVAVDGTVTVGSLRSLQVTPRFEQISGLATIAASSTEASTGGSQGDDPVDDTLHFRTLLPKPLFAAEIKQREREIEVVCKTTVGIDQSWSRVQQVMDYEIKYRSVKSLELSLPEQVVSNDTLQFALDGTQLPFQRVSTAVRSTDPNETSDARRLATLTAVVVSLPRQLQGRVSIDVSYEVPTPELIADELTSIRLPLAVPNDVEEISHEATVTSPQTVLVALDQRTAADRWRVVAEADAYDGDSGSVLRLRANGRVPRLSLYAQADADEGQNLATLERAWFQTWVADRVRQERAVFRFRTKHSAVLVVLPESLDANGVELLLDGTPLEYESQGDASISVALPDEASVTSHTLELRYQVAEAAPDWGRVSTSLPRLVCHAGIAPIYWQLILPRNLQVLSSPSNLIPDYSLGWRNSRWGRQPSLSQGDLEQSTGATSLPTPPSLSTQYVYRAFESPDDVTFTVIRRVWPVAAGALLVFGLGLVATYTSLVRKGPFWLALSIFCVAGISAYPEVTLLFLQVVLLGGVLVLLAHVVRKMLNPIAIPISTVPSREAEDITQLTEFHDGPLEYLGDAASTATLQTDGRTL